MLQPKSRGVSQYHARTPSRLDHVWFSVCHTRGPQVVGRGRYDQHSVCCSGPCTLDCYAVSAGWSISSRSPCVGCRLQVG